METTTPTDTPRPTRWWLNYERYLHLLGSSYWFGIGPVFLYALFTAPGDGYPDATWASIVPPAVTPAVFLVLLRLSRTNPEHRTWNYRVALHLPLPVTLNHIMGSVFLVSVPFTLADVISGLVR